MMKINNWMLKKAANFKSREEGQGLAEYGLILALVAILCVGALGALQGGIVGTLTSVTTSL